MNVDEAMETAAAYWAAHEQEQEPLFDSEEAAITLANEVGRLRAELAETKAEHIGLGESHDRLEAELAAAKAASVCPVDIVWFYQSDWGQEVNVELKSEEDAVALMKWLRDRVKERVDQ